MKTHPTLGRAASLTVLLAALVNFINTFSGQGKYFGRLKIAEVKLQNRGARLFRSVRLGWAIVNADAPGAPPLLEGAGRRPSR